MTFLIVIEHVITFVYFLLQYAKCVTKLKRRHFLQYMHPISSRMFIVCYISGFINFYSSVPICLKFHL